MVSTMKTHEFRGRRFGRLVALKPMTLPGKAGRVWKCMCDCGKIAHRRTYDLRIGNSTSCGCAGTFPAKAHGKWGTRTYRIWRDILMRCKNPNRHNFKYYGGRGVSVCTRWEDFSNFLSDMGEVPEGMTIERNDVNGDYSADNCRWATVDEQARNRRNNVWLEHNGRRLCRTDWAFQTGISVGSIRYRLRKGWTVSETLSTPPHKRAPNA